MTEKNRAGAEARAKTKKDIRRHGVSYDPPQTCAVCGLREFDTYDLWLNKTYCSEHAPEMGPETQKKPRPGRTGAGANW